MKKKILSLLSLGMLLAISTLTGCGGGDDISSADKQSETKQTFTVSFYVGDTLFKEVLDVEEGSKLEKPTDPVMAEDAEFTYEFAGWYETGASQAWSFEEDVVSKNLELFADFTDVAKVYDLSIWIYGGGSTTYISEEEANRVKEEMIKALPEKDIYLKYVTNMNNDAFNAAVLNATNKPDVVVSGNKMDKGDEVSLVLNETYDKVKVGQGWFNNSSRCVGVLDTCTTNLDNAVLMYEKMSALGPDYFEFAATSLPLKMNETTTLAPTLAEGETRKVTYTSSDSDVVTVDENGLVTPLKEGEAIIKAQLGLISVDIEVKIIAASYELVVYLWGKSSSASSDPYITEAESDYVKSEFIKTSGISESELYWEYVTGVGNDDFNATVNAAIEQGLVVDVVISGNKVDNGDEVSVVLDSTYGKVLAGAGWFTNTTRRVAITEACDTHLENAIKLYDLVKNVSPLYEGIILNKETATVQLGKTLQLEATAYGEVTWETSDASKATVVGGLVTPVAVGTVTITARSVDGNSATCEVTIEEAAVPAKYDLVVYVYLKAKTSEYITQAEYEAIVAEFTKEGAAGYGKNISWKVFSGGNQAALGAFIDEAVAGEAPDVIIGRSGIKSDSVKEGLIVQDTYTALDASWTNNTGNYVAICSSSYAEHEALATSLINLLKAAKPAA